MLSNLWTKWKSVAPWVAIVCFVMLFVPWFPDWVLIIAGVLAMPAVLTVYWETEQQRKQAIFNRGYQAGQEAASKDDQKES